LRAATGRTPRIVGKPHTPIFRDALSRGDFHRPLVIGDRLDTDIAGANSAGLPSLLVLSGVTTAAEALKAPPEQRPTFVAPDLSGINADSDSLRLERLSLSSA
jgi:ribonucleotide monophosphatase NagD (HAD superfamily)